MFKARPRTVMMSWEADLGHRWFSGARLGSFDLITFPHSIWSHSYIQSDHIPTFDLITFLHSIWSHSHIRSHHIPTFDLITFPPSISSHSHIRSHHIPTFDLITFAPSISSHSHLRSHHIPSAHRSSFQTDLAPSCVGRYRHWPRQQGVERVRLVADSGSSIDLQLGRHSTQLISTLGYIAIYSSIATATRSASSFWPKTKLCPWVSTLCKDGRGSRNRTKLVLVELSLVETSLDRFINRRITKLGGTGGSKIRFPKAGSTGTWRTTVLLDETNPLPHSINKYCIKRPTCWTGTWSITCWIVTCGNDGHRWRP